MKVSVVMITYNKAKFLDLTLCAFSFQSYKNFELILVDDGSTDDTKNVVSRYKNKLNLRYINQENRGRAFARNVAIKNAKGMAIIFCDDDRLPSTTFVEEHVKNLSAPKSVIIGFKQDILTCNSNIRLNLPDVFRMAYRNPQFLKACNQENKMLVNASEIMCNIQDVIDKWTITASYDNKLYVVDKYSPLLIDFYLPWAMTTTGNMSYTRDNAINLEFDEHYSGWGMEDTDFAYRLYLAGYKFTFSFEAQNYHQLHERGINEHHQLTRNMKYFCEKYNNIETHLYGQAFYSIISNGQKLIEANEIFKALKSTDTKLVNNYIQLCLNLKV